MTRLVTLRGKGMTLTATPEVAGRMLKSDLGLSLDRTLTGFTLRDGTPIVRAPLDDCEPGGCGTCAGRKSCALV